MHLVSVSGLSGRDVVGRHSRLLRLNHEKYPKSLTKTGPIRRPQGADL